MAEIYEKREVEIDLKTGVRHGRKREGEGDFDDPLKSCSSVNTGKSHSSFAPVPRETELQATGGLFMCVCVCVGLGVMCVHSCVDMRPNPCVN